MVGCHFRRPDAAPLLKIAAGESPAAAAAASGPRVSSASAPRREACAHDIPQIVAACHSHNCALFHSQVARSRDVSVLSMSG